MRGATSGSPRRARTRASTVSDSVVGKVDTARRPSTTRADFVASVQRPSFSSTRERSATRYSSISSTPWASQYSSPASISPSVRNDSAAIASSPLCSASARACRTVSGPADAVGVELAPAEGEERVRHRGGIVRPRGELVGACRPLLCGHFLPRAMAEERQRRVGMHELRAGAGATRGRRSPRRHRPGLRTAAGTPEYVREGRKRLALSPDVAPLAIEGGRVSKRTDRVVRLIGEVALVRAPREKGRDLVGGQTLGEAERARILVGRLLMRRDGRGIGGRERCELEHGIPVPGGLRVVREPRQLAILPPAREERVERGAMQAARASRRNRLLDGESGELVPERDALPHRDEHARGDALVEPGVDGSRRASREARSPRAAARSRQHRARPGRPARAVRCGRGRRREPWPGSPCRRTPAPPSRRTRSRRSSGAARAGRSRTARRGARRRRAREATAERGGGRRPTRARRP